MVEQVLVTGSPMLGPLEAYYLAGLTKSIGSKTIFAELGTWTGQSASVIAQQAKICGGYLYCIDHWQGNKGTELYHIAQKVNVYQRFKQNMETLGLWDSIIPIKRSSLSAYPLFADQSIDFLFMDADHRHQPFMQDLSGWLPKLKRGGLLCGHDCEGHYYNYPQKTQRLIDNHLDIDYTGKYHAGVIRALYDFFNDEYILIPNTTIWFKWMS